MDKEWGGEGIKEGLRGVRWGEIGKGSGRDGVGGHGTEYDEPQQQYAPLPLAPLPPPSHAPSAPALPTPLPPPRRLPPPFAAPVSRGPPPPLAHGPPLAPVPAAAPPPPEKTSVCVRVCVRVSE